ncbi:hypothetical protein GSY74_08380 [Sulfurovum sp. bin170]|uniref:SMI1/KNR4 family protein n=1 Tax=Sulfurovum sp. bin170 TaxID=2695268 RepID=UPI0013DF35CF|nr:SMI1/KNR4 family protein [Sulfurovum sp. bin170]NEW61298.1 hypothetical protein [Sulfurovum sp. bin170]
MKIEELEVKYSYKFPKLFKKLWSDGMLDWMGGRTTPFGKSENWAKTIYPCIKDNPPLLLHTGGFDFEMLRAEDILSFKFDELWDVESHEFIPFAKSEEGNIFAFYKNLQTDGESAIVYIWDEMNETEVLAKNFEDFIFRKMLEAIYDVDKDELLADYKDEGFEGYLVDIRNDLKTTKPYLNDKYAEVLSDIYSRKEVMESRISYSLITHEELAQTIQTHLEFEELDLVFEHEVD